MSAPPPNDKALYDPYYQNSRKNHNRRKKPNGNGNNPCRGRSNDNNSEQGRTFFDWSFSYYDVNYNYNTNCGGGSNNGGANYPSNDFNPGFGGSRPPKPILSAVAQQSEYSQKSHCQVETNNKKASEE